MRDVFPAARAKTDKKTGAPLFWDASKSTDLQRLKAGP